MKSRLTHLSRRFMIHVCKDGTVTYRDTSLREPVFNGVALPVFSCDTAEQAEALQVFGQFLVIRFCRRGYEPLPQQPGRPWYRLSTLGEGVPLFRALELEDLEKVTLMFAAFYSALVRPRLSAEQLFPAGRELSDTGLMRAIEDNLRKEEG
jgi:hypothetical protein